jgi:long-chain acyl-CoA synthetase
MGLYDFTLYDLISRNAVCFGNRRAWYEVDDGRTLTFSEYKNRIDRLACGLQSEGVGKGDRIGALGKNSLEYFLLYGAASAIGAVVLPINWRLSPDEICFNLNDCAPVSLFVDSEYQDLVTGIRDKLPSVRKYYNLKPPGGDFLSYDMLLENSGDLTRVGVGIDDGFVIIHTAAVNGRPRGALLSHGNVLFADMHWNCCLQMTCHDVHLNLLPLFHVGGLFMATNAFHAGALNVNMSKFDAARALELIDEMKVSLFFDFSPILSSILDQSEKTGKDMKSLRAVVGLDNSETIERYQKTTGGTFYSMYGQTETSCVATFGRYSERPGSAGRMIHLAEVRVVDDYDRPLPAGQIGEIVMKGPMVFKGYWNLPEENRNTFREGWHHTGDLGRFDEEGFLWYAGRTPDKELIKPGGENVYPAEVEKVILMHPAVDKCIVFGVPDPKWKEGIKAVCLLKKGKSLQPKELIGFVGERIASYKKPQYVEFVKDFPSSKNNLPDRAKIKELYGGNQY